MHPTRPNGWVDLRRPGDYPIILGETLKSGDKSPNSLINIRYNWQPKSGFASRNSRLTESGNGYQLSVKDVDSEEEPYQYSANSRPQSSPRESSRTPSSLALVFDKSKSAFVLESISTSIDMNLKSGPGHPVKSARSMPQLPSAKDAPAESSPTNGNTKSNSTPDDDPGPGDSANPFDFRHFIAEARENLEKTSQQQAGNRTPMSMSGISTPVPPGAGRFTATTPQMPPKKSTPVPKSTGTAAQKRGPGHSRTTSSATAAKRNPPTNSKIKSQERIVDSSSSGSENETIAVVRRHQTSAKSEPTKTKASRSSAAPASSKSHSRNLSANIGSSPHIIINDDEGGLEIDMGSPPPEDKWKNRRNRINPEMFDRSHTGTPIGGASRGGLGGGSGTGFGAKSNDRDHDVIMKDVNHRKDDIDDDEDDDDEDNDVDEFDLGSPRDTRLSVSHGGNVSRTEDPAAADDDDEELDEEALLAAELEAALDEEDDEFSASADAGAAVGLGIRAPHQHLMEDEDESEVSEEE
ncbi:hypothetical protein B0A52_02679 [Exophiala mesophila]|uniref:Transcription elongation factor Eaf N-terminal domain-containing protein n=1 Tax=Exophiala mesophila TaxID=212818 RepID=A0A438NDR9_EXOME|nr:hypothetical protein B0A52_02679 [Exophiala mesophila]